MKRLTAVILCLCMICGAFVFFPTKTAAVGDNEAIVAKFLRDELQLNTAGVCGVLANIEWESGFNPNIEGDNGTSYGICQWHNSRWDNLKSFCNERHMSWKTLEGQLWFLKYELENSGAGILKYIRAVENSADGAYDAAYYWCYYFERPADTKAMSEKRGNLAKTKYWPIYSASYSVLSDGVYRFQNKSTGTYMSVLNGKDENGSNVELLSTANASTVFEVANVCYSVFNIKASCSAAGRMLNIYASTVADGKNVTLYDKTSDSSQQWYFEKVSNGYVIRSVADSSLALDVSGTNVLVKTYSSGKTSQIWTAVNITSYKITYDANGGSGAPAAQSKTHNSSITLSTAIPTRDGYNFKGWATSADATVSQYAAGATYSTNEDVKLYAVWEMKPCEGEGGVGHNLYLEQITKEPTCTQSAMGLYFCTRCEKEMEINLLEKDLTTEWSTKTLSNVSIEFASTKTQYRGSTGEYRESYEPNGVTGTALYASFPAGFDKTNALYTKYCTTPDKIDTGDKKRQYNMGKKVVGYIYWHWCCSSYTNTTPDNLYISTEKTTEGTRTYDTFHAFFSTTYVEYDSVKDGTKFVNADACCHTYWWQTAIPVYGEDYTELEKVQAPVYGAWQDTPITPTEGQTVETRTLYRYSLKAAGHNYAETVTAPKCTEGGYSTFVCSRCKDTYRGNEKASLGHAYVETVTKPTCTEGGYSTFVCSRCKDTYTGKETEATGHKYVIESYTKVPTCTESAKASYICQNCKGVKEDYIAAGEETVDWSETKLSEEFDDFGEAKTQYRLVGDEPITTYTKTGTGETLYASFPAGFDKSHIFYTRYNKTLTNSNTVKYTGEKTVYGYIYWHWCSSSYTNTTPGNLLINTEKTDGTNGSRAYDTFHAFFSTKYVAYDTSKEATKYENAAACPHTYWWQEPITVYAAKYDSYTAETNPDIGEWTEKLLTPSEGYSVETRVLYRYSLGALGHDYQEEIKEATCTVAGEQKLACTRCKDVKSVTPIEPTGHVFINGVCAKCAEPDPDYNFPGDINFDKKVTAQDASMLKKMIVKGGGTAAEKRAADLNCDNKITAVDANIMIGKILGKQ